MTEPTTPETKQSSIGRNEPCPCGSGKKYKRCCGVAAAPKLTARREPEGRDAAQQMMNQMDPQYMTQVTQAMQRLPKSQLQKLQNIMQKAMNGKDVTREAEEFQNSLPPEMQHLLASFAMPGMAASADESAATDGMTEEQARELVAKAAADGKISKDQAETLLTGTPAQQSEGKFGKLWKGMTGKK